MKRPFVSNSIPLLAVSVLASSGCGGLLANVGKKSQAVSSVETHMPKEYELEKVRSSTADAEAKKSAYTWRAAATHVCDLDHKVLFGTDVDDEGKHQENTSFYKNRCLSTPPDSKFENACKQYKAASDLALASAKKLFAMEPTEFEMAHSFLKTSVRMQFDPELSAIAPPATSVPAYAKTMQELVAKEGGPDAYSKGQDKGLCVLTQEHGIASDADGGDEGSGNAKGKGKKGKASTKGKGAAKAPPASPSNPPILFFVDASRPTLTGRCYFPKPLRSYGRSKPDTFSVIIWANKRSGEWAEKEVKGISPTMPTDPNATEFAFELPTAAILKAFEKAKDEHSGDWGMVYIDYFRSQITGKQASSYANTVQVRDVWESKPIADGTFALKLR